MTFLTYASNIYDMIDELVDQLVAADNTIFEKVATNSNTKACVHYTGNSENLYIQFKAYKSAYTLSLNGSGYTGYVVEVQVGTAYDTGTYEVTTGITRYFAPLYFVSTAGLETTVFSTRIMNHILWVDKNGFFWSCANPYNDYGASGFLMCMQFLPMSAKEYDDSASGVFYQCYVGNGFTYSDSYQYGPGVISGSGDGTNNWRHGQYGVIKSSVALFNYNYWLKGFKSAGNSKIYFDFPTYYNNPTTYTQPILKMKRFFITNKVGLAANDIVTWVDGEVTRKFILIEVYSLAGTSNDLYAIPYENAVVYE